MLEIRLSPLKEQIMGTWRPFSFEERSKIESLIKQGFSFIEIGKIIGRNNSSVKHEVMKNGGYEGYGAQVAQEASDKKKKETVQKRIHTLKNPRKNPFKSQNHADLLDGRPHFDVFSVIEATVKLDIIIDLNNKIIDMLRKEGFRKLSGEKTTESSSIST